MPLVQFEYHRNPDGPLTIETGANQISWTYNLNTQAFPTYAGEVVQVLSTNIDVLTIQGDLRSYSEMEKIYRWFLFYIQDASQGNYSEDPVLMKYPHRGWLMQIQPIRLPALRYGRDVVVPQWQMQAHIVEPDPEQTKLTLDAATSPGFKKFASLTADVGFRISNPYSDPEGILTKEEHELWPDAPNRYEGMAKGKDSDFVKKQLEGIAKRLNDILNEYISEDNYDSAIEAFDLGSASKPSSGDTSDDEEDNEEEKNETEKESKERPNG